MNDFKEINTWLKVVPWSRNKLLQEIYWIWYVNAKTEKQVKKNP